MGKLIISENVTLDGVVEDPTGETDFDRGGWFSRSTVADLQAFAEAALEEARAAGAFAMGRRTYEFLASRWPSRTGDLADVLNTIPKYVVSSTLREPAWHNTVVLGDDAIARIAALRDEVDGDVVVPGSFRLIPALVERDLVDRFRLIVYPVVLGTGERLFGAITDLVSLQRREHRPLGENLTFLEYEVVRCT